MRSKMLLLVITGFFSGCASITPTKEVVEGYKIYDIQATYSPSLTAQLSSNLKNAMQQNADDVQLDNELPPSNLPEKPARFELVNPFKNATGIMAMAGNALKIPKCEGSVMEATSHDSFAGAEKTIFFVCLMPYQKGYHMNIYFSFTRVSGGISSEALGRSLAQSIVGDSSQFIPRTISALEGAIKSANVIPTLIESYPN